MPVPVTIQVLDMSTTHSNGTIPSKINWENAEMKRLKDHFFKKAKRHSIESCLKLMEHHKGCRQWGSCEEGVRCARTRIVVTHYNNCRSKLLGKECQVCDPFRALCQMGSLVTRGQNKRELLTSCWKKSVQGSESINREFLTNLQTEQDLSKRLKVAIEKPFGSAIPNKEVNQCRIL